MVKFNTEKVIKTSLRLLINVIFAGVIFYLATTLLSSIETSTGVIIGSIVTLLVLVVVIPMIFEIRKGPELISELILAIPAGFIMITLIKQIFKVEFTVPSLGTDASIFSLTMALAVGSYFLSDLLRAKLKLLE